MQLNRPEPLGPPSAYRTYQVAAPLSTHFVPATCADVDCPDYLNGWRLRAELLDAQQAHVVRASGRHFTGQRIAEGETWWCFPPGQACFRASQHRRRLEREERFIIRGGDFRGNPSGVMAEVPVTSWVDDFGEHQDRLSTLAERG